MNMTEQIRSMISEIVSNKKEVGGVKHVIWIGAGGSNGGFYAAQYFMDHESKTIHSQMFTSNEFVYATPAFVGENSVVVLCSMRGTPETCVAAKVAKEKGATTVGLYVQESLLTETCDYNIQYQSIALDESKTECVNSSVALNIAMNLTELVEGYAHYEDAMHTFEIIDCIYRRAVEYCTPLAKKWAAQNANEKTIYVMASGPAMGSAYIFSICNIEEMLQIDSPCINCCEFFHGPFEVLDKNTSVFLLVSDGRTRALDERAIKFLNQYGGEKVYMLDAKEIGIDRIKDSVSEYFHHVLFSPLLNNVYMRELSYAIKKDYMTRRYMWKVEY